MNEGILSFNREILDFEPDSEDSVYESMIGQYEKVIIESIVTSFGLDMLLIQDQYGGDVDTINNVRKIDGDPQMSYKNKDNLVAYENRGPYDSGTYHSGTNYQDIKHTAKEKYRSHGETMIDAYTGEELHFLGRSKGAPANKNAELDHVISAKNIHDDRGRVLAGLSGTRLANARENLKFTNKSLNASMGADEIPEYIEKHPELDQKTKDNMMKFYNKSKKIYEHKIAIAYYTSPEFARDTVRAAHKVGIKMGLRQALGFFFTEVWLSVKKELNKLEKDFSASQLFTAIGNGIKRGFENAKSKYAELFKKLKDGAVAGVLSSLTTTLCNIFFSTAKNTVKIVRQTWASIVEAFRILMFNPDNLFLGERIRATMKIIATGASIVAGVMVSELIEKSGIGVLPVIGSILSNFCGSFITGIMTISLLNLMDRSSEINDLVKFLNKIDNSMDVAVNYYAEQAKLFRNYAAQLLSIDIEKFEKEVNCIEMISNSIENVNDPSELNNILKQTYKIIGFSIPWGNEDFGLFLSDKNKVLKFD